MGNRNRLRQGVRYVLGQFGRRVPEERGLVCFWAVRYPRNEWHGFYANFDIFYVWRVYVGSTRSAQETEALSLLSDSNGSVNGSPGFPLNGGVREIF